MGYGGHALHMIKVLAQNRDLRKANRAKIKETHSAYSRPSKNHKSLEIKRKDISAEELEKINSEMKLKIKKQEQKERIIALVVTFVVLVAMFLFIYSKIR
ncbi:hypothetical protein D0T49_09575 [Paludibacter sp. 221]|nr:hypothetical protein [Paludibacter sp. 221]